MIARYRLIRCLWLVGLSVVLGGCTSSNQPPTVEITAPEEGVLLGSTVEFQSEADDPDGQIERYHWDFGDGATSNDPHPTHRYTKSGEYRVELVVTDDRDSSALDGITIEVQVGPKAVATLRQAHSDEKIILQYLSGEAPLTVAFDGSRSLPEPGTQIISFHWDFGDGEESDEPNPVHSYTRGGEYTATLTVTDDRGQSDQAQVIVEAISYEAFEESLELGDLTVTYRLHHKSSSSTVPLSMIYQYVVTAPRKLTAEEIEAVLEEIIEEAKKRPRISRITVHLFSEAKANFMVPGDYDHYLGYGVWDATEPPETALSFNVNRSYLKGEALSVLGYEIREELIEPGDPECGALCERYRIAAVEIYLQDEPLCRELALNTIREVARWRLSAEYEGYLVEIYSRDVSKPLAWAVGRRDQGPDFAQLLLIEELVDLPQSWDSKDETLWLNLGGIPPCQPER